MHYKNGRPAKIADNVVGIDANGNQIAGMLVDLYGGDTCNCQVLRAAPMSEVNHMGLRPIVQFGMIDGGPSGPSNWEITTSLCTVLSLYHVDDVMKCCEEAMSSDPNSIRWVQR